MKKRKTIFLTMVLQLAFSYAEFINKLSFSKCRKQYLLKCLYLASKNQKAGTISYSLLKLCNFSLTTYKKCDILIDFKICHPIKYLKKKEFISCVFK